jgi:DNA-binding Xre family transcriptional regulator
MKNTSNDPIIDVDQMIEIYNKKNPELRKLDRKTLAEQLDMNIQVFSSWKNGKTPKLIFRLLEMSKIADCKIEDFIQKQ